MGVWLDSRLKKAQPTTGVGAIASIPIVSILKIEVMLLLAKVAAPSCCCKSATGLYDPSVRVALAELS
jgi:hypothetical protein